MGLLKTGIMAMATISVVTWSLLIPLLIGPSLPFSPLHENSPSYDEQLEQRAREFIEKSREKPARQAESPDATFCVCIVGAERPTHNYLYQNVYTLLESLSPDEMQQIYTVLNFVPLTEGSTGYADFVAPLFSHVLPQAANSPLVQRNMSLWLQKETNDYLKVSRVCLEETRAQYIVLVEDDSMSTSHVIQEIRRVLAKLPPKWFTVKLFWTEAYDGWGTDSTPGLVALVLLCSALLYAVLRRRCWRVSVFIALLYALLFCLVSLWVPLMVGRQHSLPLYVYGLNAYPRSMTTALMFNRESLTLLCNSPAPPLGLAKDLWIDRIAERLIGEGVPSYTFLPSLFQHIGDSSSKPGKSKRMIAKKSLTFRRTTHHGPDGAYIMVYHFLSYIYRAMFRGEFD